MDGKILAMGLFLHAANERCRLTIAIDAAGQERRTASARQQFQEKWFPLFRPELRRDGYR
jgi:hypothetical protein